MKVLRRDPDKGYIDSLLWVPKKHINVEGTKKALTFTFLEQQNISILSLWKETEHHLLLPREFWDPKELEFPVVDARPSSFPSVKIPSNITLDFLTPSETTQRDALTALLKARGGILQLACGKGKTVVALELASRLGTPTLVIVDNTHLLGQWREAILGNGKDRKPLLGLKPEEVGLIQGDVFDWKKPIVLATYQTLANKAESLPEEVRRWFGLIIWDEGHHIAAPTFARSADLFYGYRLALTATPTREDGLHIVYDFHIGKVIFKDLRQELRPRIYFLWTGLELDLEDEKTRLSACDKNGELHLSKLSTHFGQWEERLQFILTETKKAIDADRKVLVLSNSVDELINLLSMWTAYTHKYTEVSMPTEKDVGENVPPVSLDPKQVKKIMRMLPAIRTQLKDPGLNSVKRQNLLIRQAELSHALHMNDVAKKVETELNKRRRAYLKDLLVHVGPSDAGLMIHRVKPKERAEMLRTKQVVFAVAKYGREGLDEQALDTVLVCEPYSSRNTLQQVMGRVLRKKTGKKTPVVIFLEDNIGPIIGMCQKLRKHLREWPIEENGPYDYEMVGHPTRKKKGSTWTTSSLRAPGQ
jgi:superfamily II DNA or RNA helicase